jgi:hypothetical protein
MRERNAAPAPSRSGLFGTIMFAVAAFAIGAGSIAAWKWFSGSSPPPVANANPPAAASIGAPAPTFAGNRLGRAGTAPLLRTCTRSDTFEGFGAGSPDAIYTVLTTAGTMSRLAPLIGAETGDGVQLAEYWRVIADCVYQQNSWHLCDADNRALAVESASGFIRSAARIATNSSKARDAQNIVSDNAQARQRVLEALRTRLRNGHIIAADFGPLQPPEITSLLADTRTVSNGCAK